MTPSRKRATKKAPSKKTPAKTPPAKRAQKAASRRRRLGDPPATKNRTVDDLRDEIRILAGVSTEANQRLHVLRTELTRIGNTLDLNGRELVGPMLVAPEEGELYFVPVFPATDMTTIAEHVSEYRWAGDDGDRRFLRSGQVFATPDDALAVSLAVRDFLLGAL